MKDLFAIAAKNKYRFVTPKGPLTTEDLYDLKLEKKRVHEIDLEDVAQAIHAELKNTKEVSFTKTRSNTNVVLENKMEIVKYIIKEKQEAAAAKNNRKLKAQQKAKLLELIEKKKDSALGEKSIEELEAELAKL